MGITVGCCSGKYYDSITVGITVGRGLANITIILLWILLLVVVLANITIVLLWVLLLVVVWQILR